MVQKLELIAELQGYTQQIGGIKRDAEDLVVGLTDDQFKWRPAPARWSISECLEHLNVAARLYWPILVAAINQGRVKGWMSEGPYKHGWFGNIFVRAAEPPVKTRYRAPRRFRPPADLPLAQVYPQFLSFQNRLLDLIIDANGVDLGRPKVQLPATKLVKLSLGQGFALVTAHERRHLWQARQVRENPDFPGFTS
jgi:hypothetical protein